MSADKFLVSAATGDTWPIHGSNVFSRRGHAVRALVHKQDERSETIVVPGGQTHAEIVVDGF